jgi:hypothetical protein
VNDEKTATHSSELVAIFWGTTSTVGGGGDIRLGIDFRFFKTRNCIGPDKSLINFEIQSNLA